MNTVILPEKLLRNAIITGMITLALFAGGFTLWASLAPLDSAVMAQAVIKVDMNRKTVQHLEGGIVKRILVREGDAVQAGQPLIELDTEQVRAVYESLASQLAVDRAAESRLRAEQQGRSTIGNAQGARAIEERFLIARKEALDSQIVTLQTQIQQIQAEIRGAQEQLRGVSGSLKAMNGQLEAHRILLKDAYVSKTVVLELEKNISEKEGLRGEIEASIQRGGKRISELESRIAALKAGFSQDVAKELKEVKTRQGDISERIKSPRDTLKRQIILAPVAGKVVGLKVHTVGGIIAPREPLMDIVPDSEKLIVEAKVDVNSINQIRPGLNADISLPAYRQAITPKVHGKVIYVAADRMSDTMPNGANFPYYLVHISVEAKDLSAAGDLHLYPGMSAQAAIKGQPRTALAYLVGPLIDRMGMAFREP